MSPNTRNSIKQLLVATLRLPVMKPVSGYLGRLYSGHGTCLLYHRITGKKPRLNYGSNQLLSVSRHRFAEQMEAVANVFNGLDLPSAMDRLSNGDLPKNTILITFDDGYRDNLTEALPVLEKYSVPATIFITTGLIDHETNLWWYEIEHLVKSLSLLEFTWRKKLYSLPLSTASDKNLAINTLETLFKCLDQLEQERLLELLRDCGDSTYSYDKEMLTWNEIQELDNHPLITIGAHTVNHKVLSLVPENDLHAEIIRSKNILEEKLGHEIRHFAYPYGDLYQVRSREIKASANAGFESAFISPSGHLFPKHRFHMQALPRVMIEDSDTLEDFQLKLSGLGTMIQQRGRRFVTVESP